MKKINQWLFQIIDIKVFKIILIWYLVTRITLLIVGGTSQIPAFLTNKIES